MGLVEQANEDWLNFSTDLDGWGIEIKLETPEGVIPNSSVDIAGIGSKHHFGLDEDGNLVNVRNAHCSFSEQQVIEANFIIRNSEDEVHLQNFKVSFKDARGIEKTYVIREWMPDETIGVIVCILGDYKTP